MKVNTKNKSPIFGLFLLLIISFALKIIFVDKLSFWLDEAYTVWFTKKSWYELWFWVPSFESHPPFYYSLMKIWGLFFGGLDGISYRYASIIISGGVVFTAYKTLNLLIEYFDLERNKTLLVSFFIFLFNPILFWYSIEARPYILFVLCYGITFYGTIKILLSDNHEEKTPWIIFTIGATLTNWCHNLGPFYSAILFLVLFFNAFSHDKYSKRYILLFSLSTVIVTVLSIPLLILIFNQLKLWSSSTWINEPSFISFRWALQSLLGFNYLDFCAESIIGKYLANIINKIFIILIPIPLFLYSVFVLFRKKNFILVSTFILTIFAVPVATFYISIIGPNIFLNRTLLPIIFPYSILLGTSFSFIKNKYLSNTIILVLVCTLSVGLYDMLKNGYKEPWQEITDTLINNYDNDGVILLLPNSLRIPIEIYDVNDSLSTIMRSLPAEYPAIGTSTFYPAGTPSVPGLTEEDLDIIRNLIKGKQTVSLLVRLTRLFDPNNLAHKVIEEHFKLSKTTKWKGIRLYQFERI
jgi:hypothetical protein